MMFQYPTQYPTQNVGGALQNIFRSLVDWGFVDALLPFLLIFILIFAILQKIKIFSEGEGANLKPNKKINGVLAFIVAAMIVAPHVTGMYPPGSDPIVMMSQFIPGAGVLLLALFCVMILLGLAGPVPNLLVWFIALVALGFLLIIILMAVIPGFFPWFGWMRDPTVQALLIIFLTLGLVGFFLFREPGEGFENWATTWMGPRP